MRATWIAAVGLALALVAAGVGTYYFLERRVGGGLPAVGSQAYEQTTSSFYRGLAQLQVGLLDDAKREFSKAAALAPGEPAAWANLGLAHLRLGEFDAASEPVARAVALLPGSSDLSLLQGRLETSRGQLEPGIAHLRRAVDLDRAGLRARYALAEEVERAGGPGADAEAQQLFEQILQRRPDNLAALLERARLSAKRGDTAALRESTMRLDAVSAGWPAPAQEQFRGLRQAVDAGNAADAARSVAFLRNVLVRATVFRESLALVRTPTELIAEPFERFLRLASPSPNPSPADQALTFTRSVPPGAGNRSRFGGDRRLAGRCGGAGARRRRQSRTPRGRGAGARAAVARRGLGGRSWREQHPRDRLEPRLPDGLRGRRPGRGSPLPRSRTAAGSKTRRRRRQAMRASTPSAWASGRPTSRWTVTSISSSASAGPFRWCCGTTATARGASCVRFPP